MIGTEAALQVPRLYTWVDVDEHLARLAAQGQWPAWLLSASAYWDSLELVIDEAHAMVDDEWRWLIDAFGGPLTVSREQELLRLETYSKDADRPLPIIWSRNAAADSPSRRDPRWREGRISRQLAEPLDPPESATFAGGVEICAFHSFKGGVGRTLHCVALAHELARQGRKVLLVDADLEAPGITSMVRTQGGNTDLCLADLLALLHGSVDAGIEDAIGLSQKFLANQTLDGITILPSARSHAPLGPPAIEPADLLSAGRSPYFLTESLARVAQACGADLVLVDLRAGASELSAPFLLDPRIRRVFVSTLSQQSAMGTVEVLREIGRRAPKRRDSDPLPAAVITQFDPSLHMSEYRALEWGIAVALDDVAFQDAREPETQAIETRDPSSIDEARRDDTERRLLLRTLSSPFNQRLLVLGGSWDAVHRVIEQCGLLDYVRPIADDFALPEPSPTGVGELEPPDASGLEERRRRLADIAGSAVFAENESAARVVLATGSLSRLVSAHRTQAPIQVVVGSKGSGKTFTYRLMCAERTWSDFGHRLGDDAVRLGSPIVPVLKPRSLAVDDITSGVINELPARLLAIAELVTQAVEDEPTEVAWRRIWLTALAMSIGLPDAGPDTAEDLLTRYVSGGGEAVFVIDGLEELFQEFDSNRAQRRALNILLTTVTDWLRTLRGQPLGLVTFIRRDLVFSALPQNTAQFLDRYKAYELRWTRDEALLLAVEVAAKARAISDIDHSDFEPALLQLWGARLGTPKSRDARSDEWFISALSDFNQQIQARDIVSFLAEAADWSAEAATERYADRVLVPSAMRAALPRVSREKIRALTQEAPGIGKIFDFLRELPAERRKLPATIEDLGLPTDSIRLLETNGVLFREEDQFWMPEIYRHGLGFSFAGRGRPRILAVANLVRRGNDLGQT